jgi:hypothetical protein
MRNPQGLRHHRHQAVERSSPVALANSQAVGLEVELAERHSARPAILHRIKLLDVDIAISQTEPGRGKLLRTEGHRQSLIVAEGVR